MKRVPVKKIIVLLLWVDVIFFLYKRGLITLDSGVILRYIKESPESTRLLFVFLSTIRVFIFVPDVVFAVIGGILFGPFMGFFLSMISMVFGQTIIYYVARIFTFKKLRNKTNRKYPYLEPLIREYDYKFLGLGIITPVAPTDLVCLFSCLCGMKYIRYMPTVIIANLPMTLIYSSVANGYKNSIFSITLLGLSTLLCFIFSMQIWLKLKQFSIKNY